MKITENGEKISVTIDGQLFTEYFQGTFKPCLYPVLGIKGENLTRHFPFKKDIEIENKDHPWHTGIYFTFGDINGVDFWNTGENAKQQIKTVNVRVEDNTIHAENEWLDDGKKILSDKTEIYFSHTPETRIVEYQVTYIADESDLSFGDDKEGMMAIRMDPSFRVSDMGAKVFNSEGVEGESVWGQYAQWVTYVNKDGSGISMMDHPDNLRHPTRWHARDYGLFAANPFGEKAYCSETEKDGSYKLKKGEELTLRYCFVFNQNPDSETMREIYKSWSNDEICNL